MVILPSMVSALSKINPIQSIAGIFAKFNGWNFQWLEFQTVEIFSTD